MAEPLNRMDWSIIWEGFNEWYQHKNSPGWLSQQKKIEDLVNVQNNRKESENRLTISDTVI